MTMTRHQMARVGYCQRMRKLRYASEYDAQRAADRRMDAGAGPLWTYWCPYCHGHHLTSTPPRQ